MPAHGDGEALSRLPLHLSAREYLVLTNEVRAQFTCIVHGEIVTQVKEDERE